MINDKKIEVQNACVCMTMKQFKLGQVVLKSNAVHSSFQVNLQIQHQIKQNNGHTGIQGITTGIPQAFRA